tara:strand:+ start:14950 stop:15783 length:834 start_codon:yes stop_codon:yes gene_type:complete
MEKYNQLKTLLSKFNDSNVDAFIAYCKRSEMEKGGSKNPHFSKLSADKLAEMFKRVDKEGLVLDGKHVTIQSTGITYDYIAYKNKMLVAYPETIMDVALVYKDDDFSFSKHNNKVTYKHNILSPFEQKDSDIIGAYCVIKNKRGEFLTTLSKEDLEKHRKVAKTDFIWRAWLKEMYLKTIVRKGCKIHYDDIFESMNDLDNEHFDLVEPSQKYMALDLLESSAIIERMEKANFETRIEDANSDDIYTIIEELKELQPDNGRYSMKEINTKVDKIARK